MLASNPLTQWLSHWKSMNSYIIHVFFFFIILLRVALQTANPIVISKSLHFLYLQIFIHQMADCTPVLRADPSYGRVSLQTHPNDPVIAVCLKRHLSIISYCPLSPFLIFPISFFLSWTHMDLFVPKNKKLFKRNFIRTIPFVFIRDLH